MRGKKILSFFPYILIGFVFVINIQAGITFYFHPEHYAYAYELDGIPGNIAVAGTGLLFLMWNVPYLFALLNPYQNRISLIQAIIMQGLGVIGESFLFFQIPINLHIVLRQSILKFIIFDSFGLILLIISLFIVNTLKKKAQD